MRTRDYYYIERNNLVEKSGCGSLVFLALLLAIIAFIICSCSTPKNIEYRDREVVRYEQKTCHDTLINNIHDSVYHTVFQKGDTVYDTKFVAKIQYRDKVVYKTDTCYKDSALVKHKYSTIEKKVVPRWCYYTLIPCVLMLLLVICKLFKWLRIK